MYVNYAARNFKPDIIYLLAAGRASGRKKQPDPTVSLELGRKRKSADACSNRHKIRADGSSES